MHHPKKITLIGAGNVATHLGEVLQKNGCHIDCVYSHTMLHAEVLANKLGCPFTTAIDQIPTHSDYYFFCIKDDAIAKIAPHLAVNGVVIHTSGSVGMEVLKNGDNKYGVFYPLQSFSKEAKVNWEEIPVCIEASDVHTETELMSLALLVGAKTYLVDSHKRALLHLAAVWVNNFSNHLLYEAEQICNDADLPFDILEPLAKETIRKAFHLGTKKSQTGPAKRRDETVIKQHLQLLGDENPERMMLYI
ncbi:MAG: DUF2520 domain-containing protein, partial [Bacteroidetes bacterium]|nr:DUF2520 domain-containing protein [Bacteroidota bacterium]